MRVPIPLEQSLRLLTPGPLALVSAAHKERFTLTPIGWTTPLDQRPPLVGVVVRQDRFLFELIASSGEFGVSIVSARDALAAWRAGAATGRAVADKFAYSGLKPVAAKRIAAPMVASALAHVECAVQRTIIFGDHALVVGEVLIAEADERAFDGAWNPEAAAPLHYLGGVSYAPLGERFTPS